MKKFEPRRGVGCKGEACMYLTVHKSMACSHPIKVQEKVSVSCLLSPSVKQSLILRCLHLTFTLSISGNTFD